MVITLSLYVYLHNLTAYLWWRNMILMMISSLTILLSQHSDLQRSIHRSTCIHAFIIYIFTYHIIAYIIDIYITVYIEIFFLWSLISLWPSLMSVRELVGLCFYLPYISICEVTLICSYRSTCSFSDDSQVLANEWGVEGRSTDIRKKEHNDIKFICCYIFMNYTVYA